MPNPAHEAQAKGGSSPYERDKGRSMSRDHYLCIVLSLAACGMITSVRFMRIWDVAYIPTRYAMELAAGSVTAAALLVLLLKVRWSRSASMCLIVAMVFFVLNRVLALEPVRDFGMAVTGLSRRSFGAIVIYGANTLTLCFSGLALIELVFAGARNERELETYRGDLDALVEQRTTELEAAQERLRRTERLASLGTFASGIAHELNNPLTAIVFAATALRNTMREKQGSEAAIRELDFIEDTAHQAGRIIRSVLQFSRQQPSEKWSYNLLKVANRAIEVTRRHAKKESITVSLDAPDKLPDVELNPVQIEQVFVNLLCNAVEASSPGGRVDVQLARVDDAVRVTVRDRGRGMTPSHASRIFDPFHTTRQSEGGTGLGLSITYGIVQEHNGTIRVDTALGQGTTMTVDLPLTQPSDVEPGAAGTRVVDGGPANDIADSPPIGRGNGASHQR